MLKRREVGKILKNNLLVVILEQSLENPLIFQWWCILKLRQSPPPHMMPLQRMGKMPRMQKAGKIARMQMKGKMPRREKSYSWKSYCSWFCHWSKHSSLLKILPMVVHLTCWISICSCCCCRGWEKLLQLNQLMLGDGTSYFLLLSPVFHLNIMLNHSFCRIRKIGALCCSSLQLVLWRAFFLTVGFSGFLSQKEKKGFCYLLFV